MSILLKDIYREFGWMPRICAPLIGRFLHATLLREEKRLAGGWTYEPTSFCEKNEAALRVKRLKGLKAPLGNPLPQIPAPVFEGKRG